jgi:hypothetical protein
MTAHGQTPPSSVMLLPFENLLWVPEDVDDQQQQHAQPTPMGLVKTLV